MSLFTRYIRRHIGDKPLRKRIGDKPTRGPVTAPEAAGLIGDKPTRGPVTAPETAGLIGDKPTRGALEEVTLTISLEEALTPCLRYVIDTAASFSRKRLTEEPVAAGSEGAELSPTISFTLMEAATAINLAIYEMHISALPEEPIMASMIKPDLFTRASLVLENAEKTDCLELRDLPNLLISVALIGDKPTRGPITGSEGIGLIGDKPSRGTSQKATALSEPAKGEFTFEKAALLLLELIIHRIGDKHVRMPEIIGDKPSREATEERSLREILSNFIKQAKERIGDKPTRRIPVADTDAVAAAELAEEEDSRKWDFLTAVKLIVKEIKLFIGDKPTRSRGSVSPPAVKTALAVRTERALDIASRSEVIDPVIVPDLLLEIFVEKIGERSEVITSSPTQETSTTAFASAAGESERRLNLMDAAESLIGLLQARLEGKLVALPHSQAGKASAGKLHALSENKSFRDILLPLAFSLTQQTHPISDTSFRAHRRRDMKRTSRPEGDATYTFKEATHILANGFKEYLLFLVNSIGDRPSRDSLAPSPDLFEELELDSPAEFPVYGTRLLHSPVFTEAGTASSFFAGEVESGAITGSRKPSFSQQQTSLPPTPEGTGVNLVLDSPSPGAKILGSKEGDDRSLRRAKGALSVVTERDSTLAAKPVAARHPLSFPLTGRADPSTYTPALGAATSEKTLIGFIFSLMNRRAAPTGLPLRHIQTQTPTERSLEAVSLVGTPHSITSLPTPSPAHNISDTLPRIAAQAVTGGAGTAPQGLRQEVIEESDAGDS